MVRRAIGCFARIRTTARAFYGVLYRQHRKIAVEQHSFPTQPSAPSAQGLYDPTNEHDACGVGFVAHIKGKKSHEIVQQGLRILHNLDHRGAVGADPLMGDGAGILLQIPDQFFREEMAKQGINLPPAGEYGVGMIFLPKEHASRLACEQELERTVRLEGQVVLGWRDVPVDKTMPMSPTVQKTEPVIRQIFIGRGRDIMTTDALERKLYVIRKTASHAIQALKLKHGKEYFVPSMSARTIVYKGLLLCEQVGRYYQDLADPRTVSALALVHQRFSTNTFPAWELAHPYRMVAHNGEINTVKGNVNWINARTGGISSPVLGDDLPKLWPLIYPGQSDTASFDNCLELLTMAGYPLAQAMMMMIPEAWEQHTLMDDNRRAFYEYHAAMMEPWDGPAAICFTDGRQIGATLDRNGRDGFGSRRAADSRVAHRQEVAPAAGQDVPDRHGAGPHHRRQGTQGQPGQRQAVQELDRRRAHQARRARGQAGRRGRRNQAGRQAAGPSAVVRLHAGRRQVPDGADGRQR